MAEKGIDCERVAVDIRGGENISDEYLAKNPGGRVPMLELDDGTFIGESVAICRYLEGLNPDPNLFGTTPLETAQIEMWARRAELSFMAEVAGAFRNISGFFSDRETCIKEWGEVCAAKATKALSMFENQLATNEFVAGDRFTNADITFAIAANFARTVKVVEIPELPNLERYLAQILARPSFAQ